MEVNKEKKSIKGIFYRIFVWIGGTDTLLLKDCPKSEHIKYALQGGLVLIPTIMALASGFYASYVFTEDYCISSIVGIVWGGIIFIIDRYLVATFIKNQNGYDWWSMKFFIRIMLAITLGFVASHPFVMFLFNGEIKETLTKIGQEKVNDIQAIVYKERDKTAEYDYENILNRIDFLKSELDTLTIAIGREGQGRGGEYGKYPISKNVGYDGPESRRLKTIEKDYVKELGILNNIKGSIDSITNTKIKERIAIYDNTKSVTYWVRNDALKRYLHDEKNWSIYWFIFMFFVAIDTTAVLLKTFTKYGEFDSKLAEREKYRIERKKYFWVKALEKNKHFSDKDCEWGKIKITEIFDNNKANDYATIKEEFNRAGISFDEDDKNISEEINLLGPIRKFTAEVKTLSKEANWKIIIFWAALLSAGMLFYLFFFGKNITLYEQIFIFLFGSIFLKIMEQVPNLLRHNNIK